MIFWLTYRKHPAFWRGFADMAAVSLGITAWGLMTGVAMVKSGLGLWLALLMVVTVFAGSAQLAAIPLLIGGAPVWVVLAAAFCVNLRFVVFSAHLRGYVMHLPRWKRMALGYFTGDLTYVLFVKCYDTPATSDEGRTEQIAYLVGNGSFNWLSWTSSSIVGVVLAHYIPSEWGLGFAGILALVGVACALATTHMRWLCAGVAGAASVAAYALPLKLNILFAIAASVALCLLLDSKLAPAGAATEPAAADPTDPTTKKHP